MRAALPARATGRNALFKAVFALGSLILLSSPSTAQPVIEQPDLTIDAAVRNEVITEANRRLLERYLDLPLAEKMVAAITQKNASGAYHALTSAKGFADKLTSDYRAVSQDLHLTFHYNFLGFPNPGELPPPPPDWEEQNRRVFGRLYNFGFGRAEILEGNIGIITLEGFPPADLMKNTLAAAMRFVEYTDALIIDTRRTAGGDPFAVSQMVSYFLPAEKIKTNTIYYRFGNRTEEFFTTIDLPAPRYLGREVFVVVGPETFSANEEFAYDLKQFKRATLVGSTTAGAANPAMFNRLHRHFGLSIPMGKVINPISGTNWERVGVEPDLRAKDWFSVQLAYVRALEAVLARQPDLYTPDERKAVQMRLSEEKEVLAKLSKMKRPPKKDSPQQP